jgi:hypothetical protein
MCICVRTGNDIGDEGAKALGEALKLNSTITIVNLRCIKHELFIDRFNYSFYDVYRGCYWQ